MQFEIDTKMFWPVVALLAASAAVICTVTRPGANGPIVADHTPLARAIDAEPVLPLVCVHFALTAVTPTLSVAVAWIVVVLGAQGGVLIWVGVACCLVICGAMVSLGGGGVVVVVVVVVVVLLPVVVRVVVVPLDGVVVVVGGVVVGESDGDPEPGAEELLSGNRSRATGLPGTGPPPRSQTRARLMVMSSVMAAAIVGKRDARGGLRGRSWETSSTWVMTRSRR